MKSFRKSLSSVVELYLDENKISNLSFVAELPNLKVLNASIYLFYNADYNGVRSMKPLQNLKNLTEIMLNHNQI